MRLAIRALWIVLLFASCSQDLKLQGSDYLKYLNDNSNGLKKEVRLKDLTYTFLYKPIEYIAYKEMQNGMHDSASCRNRISDLSKTIWFNVYIKSTTGTDNPLKRNVDGLDEYNYRLQYFLTKAAQNFTLYYGDKGSMNNVSYHFENNYGLTPMDVIVIGFEIPDDKPVEDIVLEYEDVLFNNGPLKVKITKNTLNQIPELVF